MRSNGIDVSDNPTEQMACRASLAMLCPNSQPRAESTTNQSAVLHKRVYATAALADSGSQVGFHVGYVIAQTCRVHAAAESLTEERVEE